MIWRLTYCNKKGVEARIDIIKGNRTPVEIVQGSGNPFTMSYRLDKNDKSGHIMTSSADIEIFETETFNIDDLKTSNETELKVEYFENNVLTWSGFILPDFFSREIGSPNIVRMTASDRITALKGVTLSDLPSRVSLRNLIELSLAQTGLSLGLVSQIQISQGSTNILDSEVLSQRLTDVRGRSISCYDILMSIMVGTNSTIRQSAGQWQVYNKLEHELRTPTIFFDKVEKGAIRTIQPVASSVGVYNEFGGGRSYPDNYDFSDGLTGWTAVNGFVATIDNRKVDNFVSGTGVISQEWTTKPVYGTPTEKKYLVNDNYGIDYGFANKPYLKSSNIPVTYPSESQINVNVSVNATGPFIDSTTYRGETNFAVIASNGTKTLHLTASGAFEPLTGDPFLHKVTFDGDTHLQAVSSSRSVNGVLSVEEGNLNGYNITVRLYGYTKGVTGGRFLVTTLVNSVIVTFKNLSDAPKGNLYKTNQGSNFTKQHDIETTVFGDYIATGLNGYFYKYPIDDTSNLYLPSGELSPPQWKTAFDTTERPLLHHISRQKSRLFSVAHDILKANINVESFDPLAVFQDCKGGKYVVVSASFDFLRSEVDVELEQIAYDGEILKRDYIYSYFGEGEDTIKSIGGIAGGGGGTGGGGGMTSEQLEMLTNLADWWKLDEENDAIYSEKSVYSLKGVSALGLGSEGGGGGGDFSRLDDWADYTAPKAGWVLSALLGYDLHTRVNSLEAGGGVDMLDSWTNYTTAKANYYVPASLLVPFRDNTLNRLASLESGSGSDTSIVTTGSGNAITSLTKSGSVITANKGLTFALASHTHTIAQITGLQGALNLKATQSDISTAINGIEIGGRNYAQNSKYREKPIGVGVISIVPAGVYLDAKDTYTISFDYEYLDELGKPSDMLLYREGSLGVVPISDFPKGKATYTFKYNNIGNTNSNLNIYGELSYLASLKRNVKYTNIKLEKGNKATDWTPAPEDQVDLTTNQTIGGKKTFNTGIKISQTGYEDFIVFERDASLWSFGMPTNNLVISNGDITNQSNRLITIGSNGNIRIGDYIVNPLYKLDVTGTGRFTGNITASAGINTPKVDFGNGFTIEPSGTELVFKYSGVVKQRMFQDGSFVATGGVAAFSQGVEADTLDLLRLKLNQGGGDSKYLSSTATQIYFDIGGATPLSMTKTEVRRGNTDNNVNLGTSAYPWANIYGVNLIASTHVSTPKITLGNGWTIEQTSASLTIRRNGIVKGTFNA